jgi:hypothetical protein
VLVSGLTCGNGASKPRAGTRADLDALVAGLNALPTEPDQYSFMCGSRGVPEASYTVTFTYRVGPPVTVSIEKGCAPAISNGNLQAADASSVLPIVQQILAR